MAAAASFWDVVELKMNVFNCLREEKCSADLSRCARVSRTWMDLALDALWFGYPQTNCEANRTRTKAIALLPASRRQAYASRVGVLDFTSFGGSFVHAMFEGLKFSALKDVTLDHVDEIRYHQPDHFRLSRYLYRTLQSLKVIDMTTDSSEGNWLTASFLSAVTESCYKLEGVLLWSRNTPITAKDLVCFFRRTRPREVSLFFGDDILPHMLSDDLLLALSCGGRLESLTLTCPAADRHKYSVEEIKAVDLQSLLNATSEPFPSLKRLDLHLEDKAIVLMPQCFPAVTQLRLDVWVYYEDSSRLRDESVLEPIGKMSQLQALEIVGHGETREWGISLPARAFIPLGCLTQLRSLELGTSFYPACVSERVDLEFGDDSAEFSLDDKMLAADVSSMFSNLTSLDHLTINAQEHDGCGLLLWWISSCCPHLSSI
jgi:hypothetical protein